MGGLLHFLNFNQSGMARKILAHKKHADGLEAPRNSLELHVENSNTCPAGRDVPYSYPLEEDRSEKSSYPTEASMKKLINEEISKQSNPRRSGPCIVARLMGMDVLPVDTKTIEKKNEHAGSKVSKKNGRSSIDHFSFKTDSSRHMKLDSIYHSEDRDADRWSNGENFGRPRPREHPLEEELQKFKEEFVAWQAARFRECSKVADFVSMPRQWPAQENLNGEKMVIYANSQANASEKLVESKSQTLKLSSHDRDGLQHHKHKVESFPIEQKESTPLRRRSKSVDFEQSSMLNYELDTVPTKIVLLKPGPDMIYDHNEPRTSSMGTLEERSSIEDFLKEVKDRLKCELQGKTLRKGSVVRGSGIETPFSEKPSKPKQIVQHTAKHAREKATRDLGMNLLSSESTRSHRSEIQFNGPGSPEFINRDTRRFLSERLRNVQREMLSEVPQVVRGRSRSSLLDYRRVGLKQSGDTSKAKNEWNSWEIERNEQEMQTRSFRHADDNGVLNRELSPRNLIRSLSAPVSGTSFGQLLLEDRHILTGAQIRRKHEAIDNDIVDVRQRKKDRFNFREKVSNFRHTFTLRRMLFGRKIQSMTEFHGTEYNPAKDILSGPTVIMNFSERHVRENSTEVPPSPASVCSSSQEEFWRPVDYLSPISTPDVTLGEEISMTQVFRQINSTLNELRRQLNQLDNRPEDIYVEQDQTESEIIDLDNRAEAYIRDLLVASGFYDGSSDKSLFTWDPLAQPISNSVFEKVEESQRKSAGENEILIKDLIEEKGDRKMLLDLLNEALSKLLGPPVTKSKFRRKIINYPLLPPPCGRKLLESVWEIIRICLYPPTDRSYFSLHSLVADDLGSTLWSGLMDEEISALGTEVECHIIGELVEEIFKDMQL